MTQWTGQLNLSEFLPIKPDNTISLKAYVPARVTPDVEEILQGREETITIDDISRWKEVKDDIKEQFLEDFNWAGRYRSENVDELPSNTKNVRIELSVLKGQIKRTWKFSPRMVVRGRPITFSELRRIRAGILTGATWFKD